MPRFKINGENVSNCRFFSVNKDVERISSRTMIACYNVNSKSVRFKVGSALYISKQLFNVSTNAYGFETDKLKEVKDFRLPPQLTWNKVSELQPKYDVVFNSAKIGSIPGYVLPLVLQQAYTNSKLYFIYNKKQFMLYIGTHDVVHFKAIINN